MKRFVKAIANKRRLSYNHKRALLQKDIFMKNITDYCRQHTVQDEARYIVYNAEYPDSMMYFVDIFKMSDPNIPPLPKILTQEYYESNEIVQENHSAAVYAIPNESVRFHYITDLFQDSSIKKEYIKNTSIIDERIPSNLYIARLIKRSE
jgi:hypothetical protein